MSIKFNPAPQPKQNRNIVFPALFETAFPAPPSSPRKLVVMFTSHHNGFVVQTDETGYNRTIGEYSTTWASCTDANVWKQVAGTLEFGLP